MAEPADATGLRLRPRRKPVTVVGVLGEIFITGGVLILLYLVWQLWFNELVFQSSQRAAANELSQEWSQEFRADPTPTPTSSGAPGTTTGSTIQPVVMSPPANDTAFATLIIPRLGADFARPVAEGVGTAVLNNINLGLGHYPNTQLPGEVGNFALASHRSAYGGAFHNIHQLVVGDSIYVETADGWYQYIFRGLEYVKASGVGVLLPVPQQADATPTERIITLTTCNPFYSSAERIIAYGLFDTWYPRAGGPPPEIAATGAG